MFVKFVKYCRGYVKIKVYGFSPERFMNLCSNRGILLWQVCRSSECYEMYVSVRDFFALGPIFKKTKTKAVILERYGFPFILHRYQKRKLFPIGIFFCLLFLFVMSLFIWEIKIEGNFYRTDNVIEDYLMESGIVPGILKGEIECEAIEKGLRQEFDDITWTSAKIEGTCLEINIKENESPQLEQDEKKVCDLVAEKTGTIVEIVTRSGVPMCAKEMRVMKGTVLVSGAIPIMSDYGEVVEYQYVRADADIKMKTVYRYEDFFQMRNFYKEYTGRERKHLYLANASEVVYIPSIKKPFQMYDAYLTEQEIRLFKDFYLPIHIGIGHEREYYETSRLYTEEEAYKLTEERLQKYCADLVEKGVQIISNSVKIDFMNYTCRASGNIQVIEKAGAEHTISVKKTEDTE